MKIPENINREHILKSIEKIDAEGVPQHAQSVTYDVVFGENKYPPKLVVSWANIFANGSELDRNDFPGGEGTPCFDLLAREGFVVQRKKSIANRSAYLLSWNPENYKDGGFGESQLRLENIPAVQQWRCLSGKPKLGDVVYLMRLGVEPRGIIAKGTVIREPYEDKNWVKGKEDTTRQYIDFEFESVKDGIGNGMLTQRELVKLFPEQDWSPQSSGIAVRSEYLGRLAKLWQGDVGMKVDISKEQFLAALSAPGVLKGDNLKLLLAWQSMPNMEVTVSELAGVMGFAGGSVVNLSVGHIAKRIANFIGIEISEISDSKVWTELLAVMTKPDGNWIWKMKDELSEALMEMTSYFDELEKFVLQAKNGGLSTSQYKNEFMGLKVKVSFGQGVSARVPWIGFFGEGQVTTNGIYPVYLFYRSLNCLVLAKGRSETNAPAFDWPNGNLKTIGQYMSDKYAHQPERYGDSYVYRAYDLNHSLDPATINSDLRSLIAEYFSIHMPKTAIDSLVNFMPVPKPFLLLAGISGTGKTRFVRQQAHDDKSNYEIVAVRPDWHEPSDLLGYVSRIGGNGAHYVVTDVLKFMVKAWRAALNPAQAGELKPLNEIEPFWLCLDEMNLAPVEQYFADYLSVLETRKWEGSQYSCDPILKLGTLKEQLGDNGIAKLRTELGVEAGNAGNETLWSFFVSQQGIPLPPNLIVAGTVNMDETTHGFSRKVIDRAFTLDFGKFFPNDYDSFFEQKTLVKKLGFPVISHIKEADMAAAPADSDGKKSIAFLKELNSLLSQTPFELAYRSLNELLLAVVCFRPEDDVQLQAVWDDFLMTKVLPRIEGDAEKLRSGTGALAGDSLLQQLGALLEAKLPGIWNASRLDLLRENIDGSPLTVSVRSKEKLLWMQERLDKNGFTAFWP